MGDLISRSAVINLLCNLHIDNIAVNDKKVTKYIRELPTVYDVDSVVEEMKKASKPLGIGLMPDSRYIREEKAVDLVRKGGVNE